jgi:hypothetical protein
LQTALNEKQVTLSNLTGTGVELLTNNNIRRIFGTDGIDVTADLQNFNINISGLILQNSMNNLTDSVNVNTSDINIFDTTVSSGFLERYTKNEVNASLNNIDVTDNLYIFDGGTYTALNLQHSFGISLAVTSKATLTSSEILLSMDTTSDLTINTSGHVANSLSVGGSLVVGTTNILNAIAELQNNDVTSFLYEFDGGTC